MSKKLSRKPRNRKATILEKAFRWYKAKKPVFVFAARFSALMILFYAFSITYHFNHLLSAYLNTDAGISSAILNGLNQHTVASGDIIRSARFSIGVKRGCDGIEPTWMFAAAVFSFPIPARRKLPGVLFGTVLLLGLNVVRIVSLFLAGVYHPALFGTLHLQVWPVIFIFSAIIAWVWWIQWALGRDHRGLHATV